MERVARTTTPTVDKGEHADPEVAALGRKIRLLRTEPGLTLEAVASAADVSRSLISAIELGRTSPSITTLRRIAEALGVPMAALFMGEEAAASADSDAGGRRIVVRRADRKRLLVRRADIYYELLTPDVNREVEFLWGEIDGGAGAPPEVDVFAAHLGEENILVLAGELVLTIDGQEFEVGPGDSVSFDCSRPHRLDNRREESAQIVVAIAPPTF